VGNTTISVDTRGNPTYFVYDPLNRQKETIDARGNNTYFEFDQVGNTTISVDARQNATYFAYDSLSRLEWQKDALENPTYYAYDLQGNQTQVTDALDRTTYFYYDALNRQKGAVDALGAETYFEFDPNGNTTISVDARGNATYMAYDEANRLASQTDALGGTSYYEYDPNGNVLSLKDPLGHAAHFAYDALDRTSCAEDPLGAKTYFDYDQVGNLTQVIDAKDHVTYYTYDALSRTASIKNALLQTETYDCDANSNLLATTDPDNRTTYFTYDALDRQTCVEYPDGVINYFVFDQVGNRTKVQGVRGWTYFTYDKVNRQTQEVAPDGAVVSHDYDAVGQRLRVTSPGGSTYHSYDPAGRMERAQAGDATVGTTYYEYSRTSRVTKKLLGNGSCAYFEYDAVDRVTKAHNCLPDGSAFAYFEYDYDKTGRITSIRREDGSVVYYGYDGADRLTSETWKDSGASTIYAFEWAYDTVGNRTYQKFNTDEAYYEYDAGNQLTKMHELTGDAWTYFTYDSRGNETQMQEPDGTTYFTYTDADLVENIKYKSGVSNYFYYDALLRRYAMQDSDGLTYFSWDQNGMNLLSERDAQGNITAEYTHGYTAIDGNGSMAAAKKEVNGSTYYQYPVYDPIKKSVHGIVDGNGNEIARYEYNAWGKLLRNEEPLAGNRFKYQSNCIALKDSNARLYLSPFRPFDSEIGRYLQRDLANRRPVHVNLYEYANSHPTQLTDPTGFKEEVASAGPWSSRTQGTYDAARMEGCCYLFTIKVYATALNYRAATGDEFLKSFMKIKGALGHAWVRFEDVGKRVAQEGGHTGEKGGDTTVPKGFRKYEEGLRSLQVNTREELAKLTPKLDTENEADPDNPIKWLKHVYNDGSWHVGDGGHKVVSTEVTWCLTSERFKRVVAWQEALDAFGHYSKYGGTEHGCANTVKRIASVLGINLHPSVQVPALPPSMVVPYGLVGLSWRRRRAVSVSSLVSPTARRLNQRIGGGGVSITLWTPKDEKEAKETRAFDFLKLDLPEKMSDDLRKLSYVPLERYVGGQ